MIQGEANRKQSDYDDAKPYTSGAPYYVTAAWSRENLTRVPENFIIGDETVTYADGEMYLNARLSSGSDYTFFVRIDLKSDLNVRQSPSCMFYTIYMVTYRRGKSTEFVQTSPVVKQVYTMQLCGVWCDFLSSFCRRGPQ